MVGAIEDELLDRHHLAQLESALGRTAVLEMLRMVPPSITQEMTAIATALERGDADAVRRASHTLKGFAGNMGLSRLAAAAAELQRIAQAGDAAMASCARTLAETADRTVGAIDRW